MDREVRLKSILRKRGLISERKGRNVGLRVSFGKKEKEVIEEERGGMSVRGCWEGPVAELSV